MPEIFNVEATHNITRTNVAFDFGYGNMKLAAPVMKLGTTHQIHAYKSGDDDPIAPEATAFDSTRNLLFTATWGSGLRIYQMAEDGTFTLIGSDTTPLNADLQYQSIAVHPGTQQLFMGTGTEPGLAVIDYTDPANLTITIETQASLGTPYDEFGAPYANCLCVTGDYLWLGGPDEASVTTGMFYRIHIPTMVTEAIPIQYNKHSYRRAGLFYDAPRNRIFVQNPERFDCEFMLITDPDAAVPLVQNLDIEAATGQNDYYSEGYGVFVDPVNSDHIWMTINQYWCKLDISTAGPTSGATLLNSKFRTNVGRHENSAEIGMRFDGYYQIRNHPQDVNVMLICPSRGHPHHFGWFDFENDRPVVTARSEVTWNGNFPGDAACYQHDYAWLKPITTTGGNKYNVLTGYGWSDYVTATFPTDGTAGLLHESGELVFGTWNMVNNANIQMAQLTMKKNHDYWEPSGTNIAFYLSNDAGVTWVAHDPNLNQPTAFSGPGTDLRIKIVFTGLPTKSAYIQARAFVVIAYSSGTMPSKIHRTATRRIRGGN